MSRLKLLILIIMLLALPAAVLAQQECPVIIKTVLATIDEACSATARNQVCYGNIQMQVTPREGVSDLQFAQAGDIADVAKIQRLQLSSFSATDDSWGLALMKLQANLPNTLPGQNITFLLFGDVRIDNAIADTPEVSMAATGNANVRSLPTTKSDNIIASLKKGQQIIASGRLADNSWVRIQLENSTGWVSAQFIEGDLKDLAVIEPQAPQFGPMQSFYFKTGLTDRPCDVAPDSGILVQSPQGAGRISFSANGVDITLGSTIYLQANGGYMTVSVVEGAATLTAFGQSQIVPAGTVARVPLDTNGQASVPAETPQPYDATTLQALPLNLGIWDKVAIATPLPPDQIASAIEALQTPQSGKWAMSVTAGGTGNCGFKGDTVPIVINFEHPNSFKALFAAANTSISFTRTSDTTYTGSNTYPNGTYTFVFTFTSATTFTGQYSIKGQCSGSTKLTGKWSSS